MVETDIPILSLKNIHCYIGPSHILRDVTFSVRPGQCLSLMGRNGMGKTTILRTIMGHIRPTKGIVHINGVNSALMKTHIIALSGIAFVPETRSIFPNLSVIENLTMAARTGVDGRSDWTLERIFNIFPKLEERQNFWGDELSGGEQQMLTISRGLMTNPSLLLLDEVTEGLAPLVREDIWRVILEIKNSGIASIIVDKHVKRLLEIADQHVILVRGEIVFHGDGKTLVECPELMKQHLGV
ncbi:MAG: High-affinity branched-chain amino acid transport ATP-binding protein LivF [Alphaproteobacteria bacterium MarineAlpha3_Bin5]|nr:MAG: High-affinity branched-chain amino acid transport ATP-binding protein LivF [Alphaproteobacteria bacterium MarineAlpha3_Bin5]